MSDPRRITTPTPANIEPFVRVLGVDGAIRFLLAFGGTELFLSANPRGKSRAIEAVGRAKAIELAEVSQNLPMRIPTAKPWIAGQLHQQGLSIVEIARTLHASDVAVRGWVRRAGVFRAADPRQLDLF